MISIPMCREWDAPVEIGFNSASLDTEAIEAFLRSEASGSVVYLLSLIQPLTPGEIRDHPFRLQYVSVMQEKETKQSSLDGILRGGVDCGVLASIDTAQENYYFLNSDLCIRPAPLTEESDMEAVIDSSLADVHDDLCLPSASALGRDHPVPLMQDPSTCLGWFNCLSDRRWREALRTLQERGPLSRRELARYGAGIDLPTAQAGIRCGVLRLRQEKLDFPFSRMKIPPGGKPWTARPPRFWMSRSYEPLRCIDGFEEYLRKPERISPMKLLQEMVEDGRRVLPTKRRKHLKLNFLYEASAVVPRIEEVGPGTIPSVWENRRGLVYSVREGYERAATTLSLQEELAVGLEERGNSRGESLEQLARRKLDRYFKAKEKELMKRLGKDRVSAYSLGADALLSVASAELKRDKLMEERKHFERFLEVLAE